MKAIRATFLLILGLSLAACAHRGAANKQGQDENRITQAEIQGSEYQNALELIQRKRPRWLNTKPNSVAIRSANEAAVYLDGTHLGGIATLRRILAADMEEAEYLTAAEVLSRSGYNHPAGAILITTRRIVP
jgi:hypothetical protein